ncbi:MAG: hypothetical protein GY774_34345 [Planctomycetes bacterium]|nr:hypothetical protein [Planctomycetota bacterium]
MPTIAPFLLPGVIKRFAEKFPHAELSVYENLTDALVHDLIGAGEFDKKEHRFYNIILSKISTFW